ncbi:MAG: YggS family pyridoxal phosphate-dependent enzyme [Rhizobiales bacterium]|nr:YggS family pyridoxal phosphate-dependent enzyme [Hyphomicrobiales bacterium]
MADTGGSAFSQSDVDNYAARLATVRERIAAACRRAGRDPAEVRLLPISKTVPAPLLRAAYAAGMTALGENKVQEAKGKWQAMADLPLSWSIVGHLQTNKARDVARFADEFQALDSLRVAEALDRRLEVEDRTLDVFVQVNTSGEESKFGLSPDEVAAFARELPAFSRLKVKGLMTLAIFSADEARVRRCFRLLRDLRDRLRAEAPAGLSFEQLSMGMSGDFEIAIEEGATLVRVGQAIFGPRPTKDADYWPGAAGIS